MNYNNHIRAKKILNIQNFKLPETYTKNSF